MTGILLNNAGVPTGSVNPPFDSVGSSLKPDDLPVTGILIPDNLDIPVDPNLENGLADFSAPAPQDPGDSTEDITREQ